MKIVAKEAGSDLQLKLGKPWWPALIDLKLNKCVPLFAFNSKRARHSEVKQGMRGPGFWDEDGVLGTAKKIQSYVSCTVKGFGGICGDLRMRFAL